MEDTKRDPEVLNGEVFESLDEILSTVDTEFVTMKAWGGKMVRLGSLTAGQMITFLANNERPELKRQNGLILIALSMVNKDGKRLVNADDQDAVSAAVASLKTKDAGVNGRVTERILLLNGMGKDDARTIAKNVSSEAPPNASPTVSH